MAARHRGESLLPGPSRQKNNRNSGRLPLLIPAKQTLESHTWAERANTGAVDACASTAGNLLSMVPNETVCRYSCCKQVRRGHPPAKLLVRIPVKFRPDAANSHRRSCWT